MTAVAFLDVVVELLARRVRDEAAGAPGGSLMAIPRRRAAELIDAVGQVRQGVATSSNVTLALEDVLLGLVSGTPPSLRR